MTLEWIWMEEKRIATIVNEIEYWKKHKLLPDQQCDFLLALYTNGEKVTKIPGKSKLNISHESRMIKMMQLIILLLLLPFSFLVLYFTEFHSYLQLGILALFFSYAFWSFFNLKQTSNNYYHLSLMISLFLLMFFTIVFAKLLFSQSDTVNLIIILNFILWLVIGRYYKLQYLIIGGILGLIFVIVYLFL